MVRKTIGTILLLVGAVIFIFPFYFMLMGSFKSNAEIFSMQVLNLPEAGFNLQYYIGLFGKSGFGRSLINSAIVSIDLHHADHLLLFRGRVCVCQVQVPRQECPVRRASGNDHAAAAGDLHPAFHPDDKAEMGEHLPGADPAPAPPGIRPCLQHLPHAAVHELRAGGDPELRARGRLQGLPNLPRRSSCPW